MRVPQENPPSESEIWAKVAPPSTTNAALYQVQRNNIRTVVEKIGDKTDAVKVYPLAGPCQLVHRHYKCTVYFDDVFRADYPIPFTHVDHKVEVVYIDKDFLRRAVALGPRGDGARIRTLRMVHLRRQRVEMIGSTGSFARSSNSRKKFSPTVRTRSASLTGSSRNWKA